MAQYVSDVIQLSEHPCLRHIIHLKELLIWCVHRHQASYDMAITIYSSLRLGGEPAAPTAEGGGGRSEAEDGGLAEDAARDGGAAGAAPGGGP
jgi:hypothetical protein